MEGMTTKLLAAKSLLESKGLFVVIFQEHDGLFYPTTPCDKAPARAFESDCLIAWNSDLRVDLGIFEGALQAIFFCEDVESEFLMNDIADLKIIGFKNEKCNQ